MAPRIVTQPICKDTAETIGEMITASNEIASTLALVGDKWAPLDGRLGRQIEALRSQFALFAASASRVVDPATLRTLGKAYEDVSHTLYELAHDADGPRAARELADTIATKTARISDLIELRPL